MICSLGLLNKLKMIILNKFLDVNQKCSLGGKTALHCAVTSGNTEVIKILATHPKLKWNEKDERGFTPIFYAARDEKSEMLEAFLPYSDIDWNMTFGRAGLPLPYLIMKWRQDAIKDDDFSSAEEYLEKMNVLLDAPLSSWNDTTFARPHDQDDEGGKTVLVRALEVEEMESLVVIFKNPHLIYDIKVAKSSALIRREFVLKCIERIKLENKMTGLNFSEAFNFLSKLYISIKESGRVKTDKIGTKSSKHKLTFVYNADSDSIELLPDSDCIDLLAEFCCANDNDI